MSISGSKLIAEYIDVHKNNYTLDDRVNNIIDYLFCDFGINCGIDNVNSHTQKYGKITPIDDRVRKDFMLHLSKKYNIYSLGRFATWRQILLDDVCKDLRVIESLINSGGYDR
jgi:hypothetical protein